MKQQNTQDRRALLVLLRLSALAVSAGYLLWKLAEAWRGDHILLPAAAIATVTPASFWLWARRRGWASPLAALWHAAPWVTAGLVFFLIASGWHALRYEKELLARKAFEREADAAEQALVQRVARYQEFLFVAGRLLEAPTGSQAASNLRFLSDLVRTQYPAIASLGIIEADSQLTLAESPLRFQPLPLDSTNCHNSSLALPRDEEFTNALRFASETGELAATSVIELDCGAGAQDYLALLSSLEDRPNQWVGALLIPAQLLAHQWNSGESELDYAVVEEAGGSGQNILYWAGSPAPSGGAWFRRQTPLKVGGRTWTLHFQTKDSFEAQFNRESLTEAPWRAFTLSLAALGLTWSMAHHRRRNSRSTERPFSNVDRTHAEAVMEHTSDAIIGANEAGAIETLNPAAARLFGCNQRDAAGAALSEFLSLPGGPQTGRLGARKPTTPAQLSWSRNVEMIALHQGGSEFPVEVRVAEANSNAGRRFTLIIHDLRPRKREQEQLQRLASFPDHNPQPIIETDFDGKITYINPEAARRFPELRELRDDHPMFRRFQEALKSFKQGRERPVVQQFEVDNAAYEQHICCVPKGDFVRIYVFDISDRRQALEDPLTGLPNRTLFLEKLSLASKSAKDGRYSFAVLFLDLDNFKQINDTYGHMIADQLLKVVARRIDNCLRPLDVVARLGGDEFTILLDNIRSLSAVKAVAKRIQERLGEPLELACHRVTTTASIGIALSSTAHKTPSDLLWYADAAMYRAKRLGGGRCAAVDPAMDRKKLNKLCSAEQEQA